MKEVNFETLLDKRGNDRLRVRLKTDKGESIDVVSQHEAFIDDKWHPIVRYDCAHLFFHRCNKTYW